jgi:hypothetical protein
LRLTDLQSTGVERSFEFELTDLARGVYFLVVETSQGQFVRKLLH